MWTDLVQAYESKLGVLEEARAAYGNAVAEVIGHAGPALEAAVHEGLGDAATLYRVEATIAESGGNATFAKAPWSCVTIADDSAGTEFRIGAWIASSWGGPEGVLRVALSLEQVHSGLDRKEWIARCSDIIGDTAPGEPFDPLDWRKFADTSPDWLTIRIASVDLVNRDFRAAAQEAHDAARSLTEAVAPLLESIRDAGLALTLAESALLRYRPTLEARAEHADQRVSPAKALGGPWQGGKYLQVGSFWLATNPAANELLAAANKEDWEIIANLGEQLGRPTDRRGGCLAVVLLDEQHLRDPGCDIEAAIAGAFDVWFDSKAQGLSALDEGEPS